MRRQLMTGGLKALEEQSAASAAQIQTAETNLDYLRGKLGVIDNDPNALHSTPRLSEQILQTYYQQIVDGDKTSQTLQTQLDKLKAMNSDKLREVLPTVTGDSRLSDLMEITIFRTNSGYAYQ